MAHIGLIAALIIVVIAIAAAYVMLPQYADGNVQNVLQQNNTQGQNVTPAALQRALSSSSNNYDNVSSLISRQINSTPELSVNYTGYVSLHDSSLGFITISMPFYLGYAKYYNDSRTSMSLQNIPLIGNVSTVTIHSARNGTYACNRVSASSIFMNGSASNASFECTVTNSARSVQENATNSSLPFNFALIMNELLNPSVTKELNFTYIRHSSYDGLGCTLVAVNGTISMNTSNNINSTASENAYDMGMCLSDQYFIPLNLSGNIYVGSGNSTITTSISVYESRLSKNTTIESVIELPGPLVNASKASNMSVK